jgi:methylmalonyl-CoA/ethylmalonyl-CoA epimerase
VTTSGGGCKAENDFTNVQSIFLQPAPGHLSWVMFKKLDHIAIAVRSTEEALTFYRDKLGLSVLFSEVIEEPGVRLTHLDLGNLHLQLVEPLRADHPLNEHLRKNGESLHHLCFLVDQVPETIARLSEKGLPPRHSHPHAGPNGRQAAFLDPVETRGVLWEITAERSARPNRP